MSDDPRTDPTPVLGLRPALLAAAAVLVVELAVSAWGWLQIPDGTLVPIHWGIDGTADGFAPKEQGLLLLPAITALLAVLLAVVPRFEPRRANLARSGRAYRAVLIGLVALLGALHVVAVVAATDPTIAVDRLVVLGVGLLFAVIGNWLGTVRSNFMFGIRTPWTLASDRSWDRTHRLTGRLWVLLGGILVVLAAVGASGPVMAAVLVGGLLTTTIWAFVFSYRVWAADPNRTPSAR